LYKLFSHDPPKRRDGSRGGGLSFPHTLAPFYRSTNIPTFSQNEQYTHRGGCGRKELGLAAAHGGPVLLAKQNVNRIEGRDDEQFRRQQLGI